jgi:hypothetical protein
VGPGSTSKVARTASPASIHILINNRPAFALRVIAEQYSNNVEQYAGSHPGKFTTRSKAEAAADKVVYLGSTSMSSPGSRGEEDQQGDGPYQAEIQGRELRWVSEEEVSCQGGFYLYSWVQGGCGTYGGCQPHFKSEVLRETDCTSLLQRAQQS